MISTVHANFKNEDNTHLKRIKRRETFIVTAHGMYGEIELF